MIGRAVSHYRVLSALGSGGMGVVYLAEDERLGRQVALKFLPPDSIKNRQALDRFRVEARAASSLSHPGICAIYDIGDDQGTPFIVMEALKGENLRDRINKGPLKVADIVEIGIQLADALEAAHTQGIIHRDIKPSNIFVNDKNRAKILDFGLAKLATGPGGTTAGGQTVDASTHQTVVKQITLPGSALGTVSYMSPEQARGEDVDTRTDLFSLGAVLFEMATGTQAFGGNTPAVIFDAILNHTPAPASEFNPLVPARLETIIATLLEKDRELRYQHASDLQAELKRLRRDLDSGTLAAVPANRTTVGPSSPSRASGSASRRGSTQQQIAPPPVPSSHWWRYGIAALAVLVAGAVAFTIWSGRGGSVAPTDERIAVQQGPAPAPVQPSGPLPPAPALPAPAAVPPAAVPPPAASVPQANPAPPPSRPENAAPPTATPRSTADPRSTTPARGAAPTTPPPQPTPAQPPPQPSAQTPASVPVPVAPTPPPAAATPPATTENAPASASPAPAQPAPAQPAPPRPAELPPQPTPRVATPPEAAPTSPTESDETLIRRVIATYKTAIETKNVALFRSVRPGLSSAEETRLRESFRQVDSQTVSITIDDVRVEGRMATARVTRQDVIVSPGRRQVQNSRQTIRFEKSATGWIITSIGG
jgi:serine/threonine protein kinase